MLGLGVGRHPAEQCSAVESSKSRGPVVDLSNLNYGVWFTRRGQKLRELFLAIVNLALRSRCAVGARVFKSHAGPGGAGVFLNKLTTACQGRG